MTSCNKSEAKTLFTVKELSFGNNLYLLVSSHAKNYNPHWTLYHDVPRGLGRECLSNHQEFSSIQFCKDFVKTALS